jgi:hypothetical protein
MRCEWAWPSYDFETHEAHWTYDGAAEPPPRHAPDASQKPGLKIFDADFIFWLSHPTMADADADAEPSGSRPFRILGRLKTGGFVFYTGELVEQAGHFPAVDNGHTYTSMDYSALVRDAMTDDDYALYMAATTPDLRRLEEWSRAKSRLPRTTKSKK